MTTTTAAIVVAPALPSELDKATGVQLRNPRISGLCIRRTALIPDRKASYQFQAHLKDHTGTVVNVIFSGEAAGKLFASIAAGTAYIITGGSAREADRRFNASNCSKEVWVSNASIAKIHVITRSDAPHLYATSPLPHITPACELRPHTAANVLAAVISAGAVQTSTGTELYVMRVADSSTQSMLKVCLWRDCAVGFGSVIDEALSAPRPSGHVVILLADVTIKAGPTLEIEAHSTRNTFVKVAPNCQQAAALKLLSSVGALALKISML